MLHLRFLKINLYMKESYRYLLHNSIYNLYHVQVQEMPYRDSYYEGVETTEMTNLISLCYMNLPVEVFKNIHRMHKLATLHSESLHLSRSLFLISGTTSSHLTSRGPLVSEASSLSFVIFTRPNSN